MESSKKIKKGHIEDYISNATQVALDLKADIGSGGITDLTYTASPLQGIVASSTGTDAILPLADATNAGLISAQEKLKIQNLQNYDTKLEYNESLTDGDFLFVGDLNVGLVTMTDYGGTSFTDLTSARTYLRISYTGVIFDETFSVNTYRFSVPKNSTITGTNFLSSQNIGFEDPNGLFTSFGAFSFKTNFAKIVLGNNVSLGSQAFGQSRNPITIGYNIIFNGTQAFANSSNSGHSITIGSISQLSTDAGLFSGFRGKLTILDDLGNNPTLPYTNSFVNLTNLLLFVNIKHKTNNNGGVHAWLQQMILAGAKVFYDGDILPLPTHTHPISQVVNLQTTLDTKVDKVTGKQLSDENYTLPEKQKLASLQNFDPTSINNSLNNKVDKIAGKGLSENDFTTILKNAYDSAVTWISTNGVNLINHLTRTDNPHNVTKAQIGLPNVDDTSDINKPISTAQAVVNSNKVDKNVSIISATKTKITYDSKGLVTAGTDATTADINPSTNRNYITDLDLTDVSNLSGVNTGDQTSVVGISGTKAQYNSSLTDGDFLFVGDTTTYTDEQAQDAVGNILTDTPTIDFTYSDATNIITADVKPDSITAIQLANNINVSEFVNNANYENTTQLNVRDTNNRNRANHTGTQTAATISDLTTASRAAVVDNGIVDGVIDKAPSQNAVFDSLVLKENTSNKVSTITASATNFPNNNAVIAYVTGNAPIIQDATTTVKGIVKLSGDLSGTADLPTVPNKVDKVAGQGLISDAEKTRLSTVVNFDNSGNVAALNGKVNGSGTANFIPKFSNSNTLQNSQIFENNTNVGVGTSSPLSSVHIYKSAVSIMTDGLRVERDISTQSSAIFNAFGGAANIISNSGQTSTYTSITFITSDNVTNVERIIITGLGNLGIGTSIPSERLHVIGNGLFSGNVTATSYIGGATLTGIPTAPTSAVGTNTNQIATTAFVNQTISAPVSETLSGIVNNVSLQELGGVDKSINGVRIGRGAGNNVSNIAFGASALGNNTTGGNNTAIGIDALGNNTDGGRNIAFGASALRSNTTGASNTAIGVLALLNNTTGNNNTAIGIAALYNNTTGNNNTANGLGALAINLTGINNTAFGASALGNNTTGGNNIAVGSNSGSAINTGLNNTYIGEGTSIGNTSNTIVLAAGTTNRIIVNSSGKTKLLGRLNAIIPAYATDAAADADAGLESGDFYKIIGLRTVMQKP